MSTTVLEITVAERLEKHTVNSERSSVNTDRVQWEELMAAQVWI